MRVAGVQLTSGTDVAANLRATEALIAQAVGQGAEFVLLPESSDYYGRRDLENYAEGDGGPAQRFYRQVARQHEIWLHVGSIHVRGPGGEIHNTSLVYDPEGTCQARYRKVHLFDVALPDGLVRRESDLVSAGDELVTVDLGRYRVGLSVCYDLRFPELYRALALAGADLLVVPAAFSSVTGPPHWETLLRARAIENQCYVLAAGQSGLSSAHGGVTKYTHGHSMLVDPWGTVLHRIASGAGLVVGDVLKEEIDRVRTILPSLTNRRGDVYGSPANVRSSSPAARMATVGDEPCNCSR